MTLIGYVWRDLLRNLRRTVASLVGVVVGVGLFTAVLFFIDGSGASMTQRALAPLALDTQRVLTAPLGGGVRLEERFAASALEPGQATVVTLTSTPTSVPECSYAIDSTPATAAAHATIAVNMSGRVMKPAFA